MNIKKSILAILILILILAIGFQILRSNFLLNLVNNSTKKTIDTSYTSAEIPSDIDKEKFTVLFDSTEPKSIAIRDNVIQSLNYMKKEVISLDITTAPTFDKSNRAVILTFENLDKLKNLSSLLDYVKNGGNLFLAERPLMTSSFKNISSLLGIETTFNETITEGVRLFKNVLIQCKNLSVDGSVMSNSSIKLNLKAQAKVLAISDDDIPILWAIPYTDGHIMIFNGTALSQKINRGIIAGAVSLLVPNFIYPVMNSKLAYIDGFPNPVSNDVNTNIYKDYALNTYEFYRDVWWPDISRISKQYNLKYTTSVIESYSNKTEQPFADDVDSSLLLYGRELLKNGGELAINGYNNQPLVLAGYLNKNSGYTPWNNDTDMTASVYQVYKYVNSRLPNYPIRTYVPPSNILSSQGKQAVMDASSDLRIISSIYTNNQEDNSYTQEFEFKNGIYELPRVSSGYNNDSYTQWSAYNAITSLGIFSHYIQPYDRLDEKQTKGKSWAQLFKDFNAFLATIDIKFPWLNPYNAAQGAETLKAFVDIDPFVQYDDDKITVYCKNFKENSYFILRSAEKLQSSKDCEFYKIDSGVYLINAKKSIFSIEIGR